MILMSYIQPFDKYQKIYVLDEKTKDTIAEVPCALNRMEDAVISLIDTYGVKVMKMHGPEAYCLKIKDHINNVQTLKYNKQKLTVEIV